MKKPAIVCVDDERIVLVSIKEQLSRQFAGQFLVETAESGEVALEILEELDEDGHDVPLIISDHMMPGLKGDELLVRVHEQAPRMMKIMLTGHASADAVGNAVNAGGLYRYISKPWDQDDLLLTVREALKTYLDGKVLGHLQEVAVDLTANVAADDRYARLLRGVAEVLPVCWAGLYRLRDDALHPLATTDGAAAPPLPLSSVPRVSQDLRTERPLRRSGSMDALEIGGLASTPVSATVSVPLTFENEVVGLLALAARQPDAFDHVPDERITGFAALAAASLHTAELIDALEAASEQNRQVAQRLQRDADEAVAGPLLGASDAVSRLRRDIASLVADDPQPVLVLGPAGSVREAVARAIHAGSARAERPFITVDCGIDETVVVNAESNDELSRLDLATGGTLFIRGIEHLSDASQLRLFEHINGPNAAETRIIATPNLDLGEAVQRGAFNGRLLARLLAGQVRIPSLRDRSDDIEQLIAHYVNVFATRTGRDIARLSDASVAKMKSYRWPGELRELIHVVEHAILTARGSIAEVDDALLESGVSFGSYRLLEQLGQGGMGEVWSARHRHLARPAAVKLIRSATFGRDGEAPERFRREAGATAALRSPHTVELYDFGISEAGELYYVMEMLTGMDLSTMVKRFGPLRPERVTMLLRQACRSLAEAHAAGLVHRDIKPANLFVCSMGGEYDFVKVLDFGMVKEADATESSDITGGEIRGTPAFMAPEIAIHEDLDGRADVYGLGCVAFYLLTGRHVFEGDTAVNVLVHHIQTDPPRPSTVAEQAIPGALEDIVMACLAKRITDRPESATELERRLANVSFERPWTFERAARWWTTHVPGPT